MRRLNLFFQWILVAMYLSPVLGLLLCPIGAAVAVAFRGADFWEVALVSYGWTWVACAIACGYGFTERALSKRKS